MKFQIFLENGKIIEVDALSKGESVINSIQAGTITRAESLEIKEILEVDPRKQYEVETFYKSPLTSD